MIRNRIVGVVLGAWLSSVGLVMAAPQQTLAPDRISDITNTKHNFASGGGIALPTGQQRDLRAVSQNETCVFCHTPHFANKISGAPLWNRQLSNATYTPYTSSSMQATPAPGAPGGSSKLCLSCHDGTLAIGAVNVANGQGMGVESKHGAGGDGKFTTSDSPSGRLKLPDSIAAKETPTQFDMRGTRAGQIQDGRGAETGYTPNLDRDLTNDHPISFVYNAALASATGEKELYAPGDLTGDGKAIVANRISSNQAGGALSQITRPALPLESGKVECGTCHDPHIRGTGADEAVNVKFLRLNRFQKSTPSPEGVFSMAGDINCVACHKKSGWSGSAHANRAVATHRYTDSAADTREFPRGSTVWEASCLNCHDNHTVSGARRLLREGTDSLVTPKSGGNAAQEETCYQCHTNIAATVLQSGAQAVADIKTAFESQTHMPIKTADTETHDVISADLEEPRAKLGASGNLANRHVECSDCHNPHRVVKNQLFNSDPAVPDLAGTHVHSSGALHTNLASGSLKGTVGVEPVYAGSEFTTKPTVFEEKKGNPVVSASTLVASAHVTREYQVCFRCHSTYGIDSPANLGAASGGTASGTNGMTAYTDQAMEFQAPVGHEGEVTAVGTGAVAAANNHRSWHPVMAPTARTAGASAYLSPFDHAGGAGVQTMYCSDCHGSSSAPGTVTPSVGDAWGPHGSNHDFILKGTWSGQAGVSETDNLCSKCHSADQYASAATSPIKSSGFSCASPCVTAPDGGMSANLHVLHMKQGPATGRCMNCHTAVPHGWKNKGLLVNLNDVGPEAGFAVGTAPAYTADTSPPSYTNPPYYNGARLKVENFAVSGQWVKANCTGCHTP